jgi:hypothetical protein
MPNKKLSAKIHIQCVPVSKIINASAHFCSLVSLPAERETHNKKQTLQTPATSQAKT